jgi:hypothetical protein
LSRPKRALRRKYVALREHLLSGHVELQDEIKDVSTSLDMTTE